MIVKVVTQVGNAVIRAKARPVTNARTKAVQKVIKDLTDSMRHHGLVGMAAPQIGKSLRIFVTEIRDTTYRKDGRPDNLRVYINPKITLRSRGEPMEWEGCGSVASSNIFGKLKRAGSVTVVAKDENGNPFTLKATGLLARVIQHELDHLNGRVFTDLSNPKTYMSRNEYLKMRKRKS